MSTWRRHLLPLTLAAWAALGAACEKVEVRAAPPGKLEGAAKIAVEHIPAEHGLVVGVSVAQLTASPLWKALEPKLVGMPEVKEILDEVKNECQIDLVADVGTLVVAMPHDMDENRTYFVIQGKWSKDKVHTCFQKLFAKYADGAKLDITDEGGLTVLGGAAGVKMYLAWLTDDTIALTNPGFEGDPAMLQRLLKKDSPLSANARFMGLIGRCDTSDAMWMVAERAPGSTLFNVRGAEDVKGFFFNLELDRSASAYMGFRFDSQGQAKTQGKSAKKELEAEKKGQFKEWLTDSRVYVADSDVIFDAHVPKARIDEMAERLASMSEAELQTQLMILASTMGGL
jgi:hypothetical protein